jgi:hypothetical protein
MRTEHDIWRYRPGLGGTDDLSGFSIEALDGGIGTVDESTNDGKGSFLVVDTGPWIFGKKVMLPAGVIDRVDFDTESVYVNRTKDEIKNAPAFDPDRFRDEFYRAELGGYYGEGGRGFRSHRRRGLQR